MAEIEDYFHQEKLAINNRKKFFECYVCINQEYLLDNNSSDLLAIHKHTNAGAIIFHHIDEGGSQTYYPISDMTQQEIYDEAIKLYCEAISMGNKRAKIDLAKQLLKKDNPYLTYDKVLGEFLMRVGLLEKYKSLFILCF